MGITVPGLGNAIKAEGPMEAGKYEFDISNVEVKTSAKGNEYLNVTMLCSDEAHPEYDGKVVWCTVPFHVPSMVARFIMATEVEVGEDDSFEYADAMGAHVKALITVTEYNGAPKNEVKALLKA